jgi:hypothetical protein
MTQPRTCSSQIVRCQLIDSGSLRMWKTTAGFSKVAAFNGALTNSDVSSLDLHSNNALTIDYAQV